MRKYFILFILSLIFLAGCSPATSVGSIVPPYIETDIDPDSWVVIPAGEFPFSQHDHNTLIDYDYQIMITDVTNAQYATFLNEALQDGAIYLGDVEVESGENLDIVHGIGGYYQGDPFQGFKHEEEIRDGNKLYIPLGEDGLRLDYDGQQFVSIPEYRNHPMTMVSWFGANAYCEYYGWRLPSEAEWEKAARGSKMTDDHGLAYPWGMEIQPNQANYYSSFDLFEKISSKLGNTTPVGFYNGKSYQGYQTLDSASPYGLYDMAGNVWQWTGDDYEDQHYRYLRGGSFYNYEVDLRVWARNSASPVYYSPAVGFRCARDH